MNDKVVIIILNYNQNDYTTSCIKSVLTSDYCNFNLILIDNGSTEENYIKLQKELLPESRIIMIRIIPNRGYVGGINIGLNEGKKLIPRYFLIMNNDTIIDKSAISELVKTCKKYDNKAIVSGKVYHYDQPQKLQDIGYLCESKKKLTFKKLGHNEIDKGQYNVVQERDLLDDVFWLFPCELYELTGGYSSYFWFNAEQADFALRAKNEGYKLIFTPYAKIWHKGSSTIGGRNKNPKLAYWHIQSTLIFRYLHLRTGQFIIQCLGIFIQILFTYLKTFYMKIKGEKSNYDYARAKYEGLKYFIKWIFIRNKNTGQNPF